MASETKLEDYFEASDKVDKEKVEEIDEQKRQAANQSIQTAYGEY